ncbi:MAG TPA: hypothetical protein VMB73_01765 [Acetobacteraceae bacterium]|nr:hypothetical protein [Acetobacteraceae bacterium]
MNESSEPKRYSKAFETLVREPDEDIVGLLAYSLFKESVRERVINGQDVPRDLRTPTKAETDAYRGRAERILERYAAQAIADAEPDIVAAAQGAATTEIIAEVRKRTGLWQAVVAGVVVWVVTIILTIVVVFGAPDWVRALVQHATPK